MKIRHYVVAAAIASMLAVAPHAIAGVPSPATSTIPSHIVLVGTDANGVPDPLGTFSVTARWLDGRPFRNGVVVIELNRTPDLQICVDQDPYVNCDPPSGPFLEKFTDLNGVATFTILGRANRSRPDAGAASVDIYCDGVLFGTVPAAAFDEDGGGLGPADNSLWQTDYFSGQYLERSDLNGDGVLGPSDLSAWLAAFFAGGSLQSCAGAACP